METLRLAIPKKLKQMVSASGDWDFFREQLATVMDQWEAVPETLFFTEEVSSIFYISWFSLFLYFFIFFLFFFLPTIRWLILISISSVFSSVSSSFLLWQLREMSDQNIHHIVNGNVHVCSQISQLIHGTNYPQKHDKVAILKTCINNVLELLRMWKFADRTKKIKSEEEKSMEYM